jgi:hypothetical protein
MNIIVPHSDRLIQAHRWITGAKDTAILNELVRYARGQGLLSNLRLYPMLPRTNYGTGATVAGIGGLTANNMTLVNGPTWGAGGLAFVAASSQYGSIDDFLGSETLTVFVRCEITSSSSVVGLFSQYAGPSDRSVGVGANATSHLELRRSSDGGAVNLEVYRGPLSGLQTSNTCHVVQWTDGGGRSLWQNKTSVSLTLIGGSTSAKYNTSVPVIFFNGTTGSSQALATITGTLTTTQRETLTDLINAL